MQGNNKSEKGKASVHRRLDKMRKDGSEQEFSYKVVDFVNSTKDAGNLRRHERTCKQVVH